MRKAQISCTAAIGGRPLTLDPIRVLSVPVDVREVESTIPCGLRQSWIDGKDGDIKLALATGTGCGSQWLTFRYGDRSFCVDITEFVSALIDQIKAPVGD